jgi:hypothetical protein
MKMKCIGVLIVGLLFMQSCYTIKHVSNEGLLKAEFINASVHDIELKFGEPNEKELIMGGYAYIYYFGKEKVYADDKKNREKYTRFEFNNNDNVINVQSTNTVPKRKINAGKTAIYIGGTIIVSCLVGSLIFLIALASALS